MYFCLTDWLFSESHFTVHSWKLGKPCMIFLSVMSVPLCQLSAIDQTKLQTLSPECLHLSVILTSHHTAPVYLLPRLPYPPCPRVSVPGQIRRNMGCGETVACWKHVILGITLGLFNFISTLINIYYLYDQDHQLFASLSLFLLWFPGNLIRVPLSLRWNIQLWKLQVLSPP